MKKRNIRNKSENRKSSNIFKKTNRGSLSGRYDLQLISFPQNGTISIKNSAVRRAFWAILIRALTSLLGISRFFNQSFL